MKPPQYRYDFEVPVGLNAELAAALKRREARRQAHKMDPPPEFQEPRPFARKAMYPKRLARQARRRELADPDEPHERTAEFQAILDAIDRNQGRK